MTKLTLTPRQERFVHAYARDPDPVRAAREAGYVEARLQRTARDLLQNPKVRAAIRMMTKPGAGLADNGPDEGESRNPGQAPVIVSSSPGSITPAIILMGLHEQAMCSDEKSSHAARVRAWELLGKAVGVFGASPGKENEAGRAERVIFDIHLGDAPSDEETRNETPLDHVATKREKGPDPKSAPRRKTNPEKQAGPVSGHGRGHGRGRSKA